MSCALPAAKNAFQPNTPTVPSVVVVDPRFDAYTSLASAAQHGLCTVHFRGSGAAALHLLSKHRADAVIVGAELDDMSRQDFVDLLGSQRFATQQAASRPVVLTPEASTDPLMAAEHGQLVEGGAVVRHPVLWRDVDNHIRRRTARGHAVPRAALVMRALNTLPVGASIAALAISVLLLR
jgi:DNA-binding NtrC family response regulator